MSKLTASLETRLTLYTLVWEERLKADVLFESQLGAALSQRLLLCSGVQKASEQTNDGTTKACESVCDAIEKGYVYEIGKDQNV